jgi:phosphatidylglycerol:prolipoprotein diacylglycerol transferase
VLFAALWWIWRKPRKDGVILSWFLILYGLGRIATEFWRLPDAHLGASAQIGGLSRGQQLSAIMVLGGVCVLLWVVRRADAPSSGGWCPFGATKSPATPDSEAGLVDADNDERAS